MKILLIYEFIFQILDTKGWKTFLFKIWKFKYVILKVKTTKYINKDLTHVYNFLYHARIWEEIVTPKYKNDKCKIVNIITKESFEVKLYLLFYIHDFFFIVCYFKIKLVYISNIILGFLDRRVYLINFDFLILYKKMYRS